MFGLSVQIQNRTWNWYSLCWYD